MVVEVLLLLLLLLFVVVGGGGGGGDGGGGAVVVVVVVGGGGGGGGGGRGAVVIVVVVDGGGGAVVIVVDYKECPEIPVNVLAETGVDVTSEVVCKEVGLPLRYVLTNNTMGQTKKTELDKNSIANDMESREKDISHALKWIQQEMLLMKEQDKLLIRKFIHLRNIIQKLKCTMEKPFSTSDINDVVSFENLSSSLSQISLQEDIFDDVAFQVMDDLRE
ncbi:Hypothetical predicted protein [Octopus vulgaris]|uniref:Uncharacterized protein n=1 Tax=Octopus vulgaris TaxID=6645 RepID=A0AA36F764_OCTVU|nr:Hypothetical predicted protein [Octopus vulgaris]